jgi:hypothetical protein
MIKTFQKRRFFKQLSIVDCNETDVLQGIKAGNNYKRSLFI